MPTTQAHIDTLYERFLAPQSGLNDLQSALFSNLLFISNERLDPRIFPHALETPDEATHRRNASEQAISTHTALIEALVLICQEHSEVVEDVGRFREALIEEQGIPAPGGLGLADLTMLEKWIKDIQVLSAWIWEEVQSSPIPE